VASSKTNTTAYVNEEQYKWLLCQRSLKLRSLSDVVADLLTNSQPEPDRRGRALYGVSVKASVRDTIKDNLGPRLRREIAKRMEGEDE
jgi:hypothetical protein